MSEPECEEWYVAWSRHDPVTGRETSSGLLGPMDEEQAKSAARGLHIKGARAEAYGARTLL